MGKSVHLDPDAGTGPAPTADDRTRHEQITGAVRSDANAASEPAEAAGGDFAALSWLAGQLAERLDALLPLARAWVSLDPDQGGPDPSELVPAGDGGEKIHPAILDAERDLHVARRELEGAGDIAGTSGLDDLPDHLFVDDITAPEPAADTAETEDPLMAAVRQLYHADTAVRAHRIAGMAPPADAEAAIERARVQLLEAAADVPPAPAGDTQDP